MEAEVRQGGLADLSLSPDRRRRVRGWFRFGLVGASGLVVNQVLLVALTELAGVYYVVSAVLATFGSTTWNFIGAEAWAFAGRRVDRPIGNRYLGFLGLNLALLVARVPVLWLLTELVGLHYATSNVLTLIALFAVRLAVADRWLWGEEGRSSGSSESPGEPSVASADERGGRHWYDLAGLLTIDSDVELRELRYFARRSGQPADIRIRVGLVAPQPTRHVKFEERDDLLIYREHLGPLAANFTLRMGDPIEIKVSPVLALSPHVVYTNIVEAFLRFVLVSKGYVLLHAAALADEHGATLMSAQTDTGKTSTVITLVRSRGYRFLSDDMTIIDAEAGEAISYPKPMTLSFHTMGVAKDGRLTVGDRAKLSMQSRLHSKSGRQVGRTLGLWNIPIMTINSVVQAVVPPPKHRIEALFPCEVGGRAPIRNVVLMERGTELLEPLALADTIQRLIENTDDAYGFPPFSTFAPRIRIGDDDYEALRRKEVELLTKAVVNARLWHLRVPGHEWAEHLPALIEGKTPVAVGPGVHPERDRGWVGVGPGTSEATPADLAVAFHAPDATFLEIK